MENLSEIESFFKTLPQLPTREHTSFDIAGYPHYENVISNYYEFFFTKDEKHELGVLFLKALLSLFPTQWIVPPELELGYTVKREETTEENGRRDISIRCNNVDESVGTAIVIENKIYHSLINNLKDYKNTGKKNTFCVVLSLNTLKTQEDKVVCITHHDLLNRVLELIKEQSLTIPPKYEFILNDFITNLKNMTMDNLKANELISFYVANSNQFKQVETIKEQVINYLKNSLKLLEPNYTYNSGGKYWIYLTPENSKNMWYTVDFEMLLENKSYKIGLGVDKKAQEKVLKMKLQFPDLKNNNIRSSGSSWAFVDERTYDNLTEGEIQAFGDTVLKKLHEDWSNIEAATKLLS